MTFSIIAHDRETGALGVAVQTRWFSVGQFVPWVEAGVGAVASQSFAEPSFGPRALAEVRLGMPPSEALGALIAADARAAICQVAIVDAEGRAAAHTGSACIGICAHVLGAGVSCQANMMEREGVPDAMLAAFEQAAGELADRLLEALGAAEAIGGDVRGSHSAAIAIVCAPRGSPPHEGRLELRVEDHPQPLGELRRLLAVQRAYAELEAALLAAMDGDAARAWAIAARVLELLPGNDQVEAFASLVARADGRPETADRLLTAACASNPRWPLWIERFHAAGHLPSSGGRVNARRG